MKARETPKQSTMDPGDSAEATTSYLHREKSKFSDLLGSWYNLRCQQQRRRILVMVLLTGGCLLMLSIRLIPFKGQVMNSGSRLPASNGKASVLPAAGHIKPGTIDTFISKRK